MCRPDNRICWSSRTTTRSVWSQRIYGSRYNDSADRINGIDVSARRYRTSVDSNVSVNCSTTSSSTASNSGINNSAAHDSPTGYNATNNSTAGTLTTSRGTSTNSIRITIDFASSRPTVIDASFSIPTSSDISNNSCAMCNHVGTSSSTTCNSYVSELRFNNCATGSLTTFDGTIANYSITDNTMGIVTILICIMRQDIARYKLTTSDSTSSSIAVYNNDIVTRIILTGSATTFCDCDRRDRCSDSLARICRIWRRFWTYFTIIDISTICIAFIIRSRILDRYII